MAHWWHNRWEKCLLEGYAFEGGPISKWTVFIGLERG